MKRSLLTDGHGIPLALTVDGANRHAMTMVQRTVEALRGVRPQPTAEQPQHLCMDKGYDATAVRTLATAWGYTAHIQAREGGNRRSAAHPWVSRPALGGGTNARLAQSLPPVADPLGEKGRKRSGDASCCLCLDHLSCRQSFRIGF